MILTLQPPRAALDFVPTSKTTFEARPRQDLAYYIGYDETSDTWSVGGTYPCPETGAIQGWWGHAISRNLAEELAEQDYAAKSLL